MSITDSIERTTRMNTCPYCNVGHPVRDYDRGEVTCDHCGTVLEDQMIDHGAEYRTFDQDQANSRSHYGSKESVTIHDKGLPTEISPKNRDANGKPISAKNRMLMYRLRKWQKRMRVSNGSERNLAVAMNELDRLAGAISLPGNIKESTAVIYRRAVKKNLIRGRSIDGVLAASVYAACRQHSVPRTLDEVAHYSRAGRKEIGRTYRFIARELRLNIRPTDPKSYVQRFCSELNLSGTVQRRAADMIMDAQVKEITSGKGPTGMAAAAIYISAIQCNERRTQSDVAEVAGVTEVTIRNRYKDLIENLGINIQI